MALKKKTGLGRGLDAIYTDSEYVENNGVSTVNISEIEPNKKQPRKEFSGIEELAQSIKNVGLISPIVVRRNGVGYTIIAGERRWRAAKEAELTEVPVVIVDVDDRKSAEMTLVENIQRKDLNPIELANGYKDMIDAFDLTQEELAKMTGKDRSSISNVLRLLDLPQDIQDMISKGSLTQGHAKAVMGLKDKTRMKEVCTEIIERDMSVRETEDFVNKQNNPVVKKENTVQNVRELPYIRNLERKMSANLGRTVKITSNGTKSSVTIGYTDNEDLETIIRLLCGNDFADTI